MSTYEVITATEYVAYDVDRLSIVSHTKISDLDQDNVIQNHPGQLVGARTNTSGAVELHFVLRETDNVVLSDLIEASPAAMKWTREQYRGKADPLRFLPDRFTMYQLRMLHLVIFIDVEDVPLKDTFRRIMLPNVKPTGVFVQQLHGRPAELFERA